jgi:hypothetical protein
MAETGIFGALGKRRLSLSERFRPTRRYLTIMPDLYETLCSQVTARLAACSSVEEQTAVLRQINRFEEEALYVFYAAVPHITQALIDDACQRGYRHLPRA